MRARFFPWITGLLLLVVLVPSSSVMAGNWPWKDETEQEALMSLLRYRLVQDKIWTDARMGRKEKGIWLFLEVEDEDAQWLKVVVREMHMKGSGADPNVSPAIERFAIRRKDGVIFWQDVVNDEIRPYADFLKERQEP